MRPSGAVLARIRRERGFSLEALGEASPHLCQRFWSGASGALLRGLGRPLALDVIDNPCRLTLTVHPDPQPVVGAVLRPDDPLVTVPGGVRDLQRRLRPWDANPPPSPPAIGLEEPQVLSGADLAGSQRNEAVASLNGTVGPVHSNETRPRHQQGADAMFALVIRQKA